MEKDQHILECVKQIESWKGSAYSTADEVEYALDKIRELIGHPRDIGIDDWHSFACEFGIATTIDHYNLNDEQFAELEAEMEK